MKTIPRRKMLKGGFIGAAVLSFPSIRTKGYAEGRVRVGLIGVGGMGGNHLGLLSSRSDVDVAFVCDVDRDRLARAASSVEKNSGKKPIAVEDLRRVLDDKSVEAIWIATPDHWHAPAAIIALDAGKHVY